MAQKLSQRTALTGSSLGTDETHIIRSGASYKMGLAVLLKNGIVPFRGAPGNAEMIVFRKDGANAQSNTLFVDDICIYMDTTADIMIVGIAKGSVSTYPTDLRDNAKFTRFYDGSAIL